MVLLLQKQRMTRMTTVSKSTIVAKGFVMLIIISAVVVKWNHKIINNRV